MNKVRVIGHRGAAGLAENTIAAFEEALRQGADGIELDVRQTADGRLVVVHDSVVGDRAVQNTPYADLIASEAGRSIPLLEEALEKFGKSTVIDIELKTGGFESEAAELIRQYTNPEKMVVSAFDAKALLVMHDVLPEVQLGYIYNRTQDEEARHHAPIDVVIPQFRLASRELIEDVHDQGLEVWAWTVNDDAEISRLLRLGVDGLITDYPAKVVAAVKG
ncbi:MAG: hypothetical protein GC160_25890 [Acidobacteria bacterium]|nr:hypothetical protein [Acidobacteriota bacterium]